MRKWKRGQGQPVKSNVNVTPIKRDTVKGTIGPKQAEFCRKPLMKRLEHEEQVGR